jgi:hypothetical protein
MLRKNPDPQTIQVSALTVIWGCFLAAALFFAIGAPAPGAQPGGRQAETHKAVENVAFNLEHKLAQAEKQGDKTFFEQALDPALVYVAYNGLVFDRNKLLASMKYVDVNNYSMENLKIRQLGADAVLVTYDLKINAQVAGTHLPQKQYASSVWVKRARAWKLVFHQATPAHHG